MIFALLSLVMFDFFGACEFGSPVAVMHYLNVGMGIESRDEEGRTPLMIAAQSNPDPEVIFLLVRNGAGVEARGRKANEYKWQTPLMLASAHNTNPQVAAALLKCGASLEVRDKDGFTPILLAKAHNPNPEVAALLIRAGAQWEE